MQYCRFTNTLADLQACYDHWEDDVSESEAKAREELLETIEDIFKNYGDY